MLRKVLAIGLVAYLVFAGWWIFSAGILRTGGQIELLNVACDPTRELWRDINVAFIRKYERDTGRNILIRQSHGGSASQARAVIDGLEADVITLALWTDTDAVRKSGRLTENWEEKLPNRSLPYTSTIVFVVRKGNPKQIKDWPDLARDGVQIITPNPKTSGNGKWSFLAMWGAVVTSGGTETQAEEYIAKVFQQVPILDPGARGATMTFAQKKIGDVHLTWENEAQYEVQESKGALEIVYPPVSVLAEPHVAMVDTVVDAKGTRDTAKAYLDFLYTEEAQEIIAKHYYRPVNPRVKLKTQAQFPALKMFSINDLGTSWDEVNKRFFAEGGLFDGMMAKRKQP